jgi:two-component sensor histidine kinase
MLFPRVSDIGLFEHLRRLRRHNRAEAYAVALLAVAIATLLRYALEEQVSEAVPFTSYFLAIVVGTFIGGFWPGIVATLVSAAVSWYLFLPPEFTFALTKREAASLLVFIGNAGVIVVLISLLHRAIDGIVAQDQYRQFLIRELHHRSQNLFSVILAIASRSLLDGQSVCEAKEVLTSRLAALARAHAMLSSGGWAGAPLNEILAQELTAFAKQVSVRGCDLVINTPAAQSFAMIIHELATNAAKYGALSCPEGRIDVEGNLEGAHGKRQFRFVWKESGGPRPTPPSRKGFGSAILFDAAKQFGESVQANYAPEGLVYELDIPLSTIEAQSAVVQPG